MDKFTVEVVNTCESVKDVLEHEHNAIVCGHEESAIINGVKYYYEQITIVGDLTIFELKIADK